MQAADVGSLKSAVKAGNYRAKASSSSSSWAGVEMLCCVLFWFYIKLAFWRAMPARSGFKSDRKMLCNELCWFSALNFAVFFSGFYNLT